MFLVLFKYNITNKNCFKKTINKKLNCVSTDKWQEMETEIEKLEQSEPDIYKSSVGFFTDNEIAVLAASDLAASKRRTTNINSDRHRVKPPAPPHSRHIHNNNTNNHNNNKHIGRLF